MTVGYYHNLCQRYRGRAVEIKTSDGRSHRGIIQRVDRRHVYMQPLGSRGIGGYGSGYYAGGGYHSFRRRGFGFGIALGTIIGLTLLPFFFW
ncbi:MAG TPA: hypothetical protein VF095_04485 [Bacillota bacterium]